MDLPTTQMRIIESAIPLFARYGYEGVSVDAIVKATGINKATLYYHYSGQQALFEAVLHDRFTALIAKLEAAVAGDERPETALLRYIEVMLRRKRVEVELMSRELLGGGQNIPADALALMHRLAGILVNIIQDGIRRGRFREVDPFMILNVLIGATNNYIIGKPLRRKFLDQKGDMAHKCPEYDDETYAKTLHSMLLSILENDK
ncbi:MAG TPA: TetR/AcrR family transcriptional regulator [Campylobacteraceae bacterium]|nr:TetR/AcrR family transcriptional regulator [Campylobacteraceae bacterium]